jgi:hypothetical protein
VEEQTNECALCGKDVRFFCDCRSGDKARQTLDQGAARCGLRPANDGPGTGYAAHSASNPIAACAQRHDLAL